MIGKLLGGRYQVVDILGTGGFGQTYVAQDIHRPGNPQCVVKHLKPASSNSSFLQNARRLFQSEAQTLERLGDHEQIPRLLAYFEENQEFYLVQDFIQGHPLSVELLPGRCWSESRVYQMLIEVLDILEYVHSQGVIHRDIKPNNLIQRQEDGKLVLVDFGSVKQAWTQVVTSHGQTHTTFAVGTPATIGIGTPGYMPTEQGRGRPRPNSDIYALGIIGIQALTGLSPMRFQEDIDTGEILWQHTTHVSENLAAILSRMVRYHFKDRYQTATEVVQDLEMIAVNLESEEPDCSSFVLEQVALPSPPQNTLIFTHESLEQAIPLTLAGSTDIDSLLDTQTVAVAAPHQPSLEHAQSSQIVSAPVVHTFERTPTLPQRTSHPPARSQHKLRIGAGITAIIISLFAGYAVYWQPRPSVSKTLEQMKTLKAAGKYEECASQAPTVPATSPYYTHAQSILYECQLAQAIRFAGDRNFQAAIIEAGKIPDSAVFYQNVEQLVTQWSNGILDIATSEYHSGDLTSAIAIAQNVPETSSVHPKAQAVIGQWKSEWEKNNAYILAAQTALNAGKWHEAIAHANKVAATNHWQQKTQPIVQTAKSRIATAVASKPTPIVAAVTTLAKPSSATAAKPVAKPVTRPVAAPKRTAVVRRTSTHTPRAITPRRTPIRRTPTRSPVVAQAKRLAPTRTTRFTRRPVATPVRRTVRRTPTPAKPSYSWTTKTVP